MKKVKRRWFTVSFDARSKKWHFKERGSPGFVATYATKADAVRNAASILRHAWEWHARKSELFIKLKNGRIQERRTYPRSSDPRRRKG